MFQLNKAQAEAVHHVDGPIMVIAGAGTGKTAVITQRIAHLVNEGHAKPEEILALTFTEKATSEMLARVDELMPMGYSTVEISTFHSFCDQILRQSGKLLGLDQDYKLMTKAESYIFLRRHLYDLSLDIFRPLGNPTKNLSDVLNFFSRLQDEDVDVAEFEKYIKNLKTEDEADEDWKAQAQELKKVYAEYTGLKLKNSMLDFGDLNFMALKLLRKHPAELKKYQEQYKYLLVDEYQDTNYTQNQLVNTLALGKDLEKDPSKANIMVVGDDDQAIYKFRGAAISNIIQFSQVYNDPKKVVLNVNYRSRQEILDIAYRLIQHNNPHRLEETEKIDKKLEAGGDFDKVEGSPIQLMVSDKDDLQADLIAKEILKLTGNKERLKDDRSIVKEKYDKSGQSMFLDLDDHDQEDYDFDEIAILVRGNSHAEKIIQALRYYGIPLKFSGAKGLYDRPEVTKLISFLRLLVDFDSDIDFFNIMRMPSLQLKPREIIDLVQSAKRSRKSVFAYLEDLFDIKVDGSKVEIDYKKVSNQIKVTFSDESAKKLERFFNLVSYALNSIANGDTPGQVLYNFFTNSGFLEGLLAQDDNESVFKIQNINKYFELINSYQKDNLQTSVKEYVDYLEFSLEVGESPNIDEDLLGDYNAVNILTVHASKGLEFPVVFIADLVDQRFPSRNYSSGIELPEELVKENIEIEDSKLEHLQEERRLFYVAMTRAKERLYLAASKYYGDAKRKKKPSIFLSEALDSAINEFDEEVNMDMVSPASYTVEVSTVDEGLDIEGLGANNLEKYSYSSIKSYERCPKQFKYRYILGLKGRPSSVLSFGISMHAALQKFYKDHMEGVSGLDADTLCNYLDESWATAGYDSKEHEETRKEYGYKKLKNYYEEMYDETESPIELEKWFNYRISNIIVHGSIDRIDMVDPKTNTVDLVDYKTGKEKELKDVQKDLQLAIYALVAEELFGFKVRNASLLFVEHGKKVSIEVTEEMKNEVKSKIHEVVKSVEQGDFEPTPDMFTCKFCDYSEVCDDAIV